MDRDERAAAAVDQVDATSAGPEEIGKKARSGHRLTMTASRLLAGTEPEPSPFTKAETARLLARWGVAPGQIWSVPSRSTKGAAHRLACGDACDPALVQRLVEGRRLRLMHTDPPYGVSYAATKKGMPGYKAWGEIENDTLGALELRRFLRRMLDAAPLLDDAAIYLWCPTLDGTETFKAAMRAAGLTVHRQIIWAKDRFVLTRSGMYHLQHEGCLFGWKQGHQPPWLGRLNQGSIWTCPRRDVDKGQHPTQKPVSLWARPMHNHLREGEGLYEPFLGSGGQVICAEHLGRICYGVELDPVFFAVVLERCAGRGLKPELIG